MRTSILTLATAAQHLKTVASSQAVAHDASHQYAAVQALPMEKRVQLLQSITEKVAAELLPPEQ